MSYGKGSERIRVIFAGGGQAGQSTATLTAISSTAWIDMKDWNRCIVVLFRVTGTGRINRSGIYVSAASTGTSAALIGTLNATTNVTGILSSALGTVLKPGVGRLVFDVSHDDVAKALEGGRYISLKYHKVTKANVMAAAYILMDPRTPKASNMGGVNKADALT